MGSPVSGDAVPPQSWRVSSRNWPRLMQTGSGRTLPATTMRWYYMVIVPIALVAACKPWAHSMCGHLHAAAQSVQAGSSHHANMIITRKSRMRDEAKKRALVRLAPHYLPSNAVLGGLVSRLSVESRRLRLHVWRAFEPKSGISGCHGLLL